MSAAETELPTVQASFNPLIKSYLVLYGAFVMAVTIVLLPLALVWLCGVGQWWARHYFAKLECELTDRSLRFRKGILVQVEKTIPLENIQDVTFVEGPILKSFNLAELKFETAGQSQGQANDMRLVGIIDAMDFRNAILARRERLKHPPAIAPVAHPAADAQLAELRAIREKLDRIVNLLEQTPRPDPGA